MNYYVSVINKTIDYIEESICEKLTLSDLARKFDISDFHFNRMFKTVSGITLKQYVLGRKLTWALEHLKLTKKPIIDIALELGFEYPEVFSRAFKKQFGLSPAYYRENLPSIKGIEKVSIVERDIINYRGMLALKGKAIFLDSLVLKGISAAVNTKAIGFELNLRSKTEGFIIESMSDTSLDSETFYTVVSCSGEDNNEYVVFCGRRLVGVIEKDCLQKRIVPQGWYAEFKYQGDMFNIREAFIDDLYKWIMVKEVQLNPNGVGMLNIYNSHYSQDHCVQILIPVVGQF